MTLAVNTAGSSCATTATGVHAGAQVRVALVRPSALRIGAGA